MRPVVFLDRDGTINVDFGYVVRPADVELIAGAASAVASLQQAGFRVVVLSNQSAVGRGMADEADVVRTNEEVARQLLEAAPEARIDLWCYAPDHPESAGDRRKPGTGMLDDVRSQFSFAIEDCWMLGDKMSDVQFGFNAGIPKKQCVLLSAVESSVEVEYQISPSLAEACKTLILP